MKLADALGSRKVPEGEPFRIPLNRRVLLFF